jgi:phage terminase large subunit-like protein
MQRMVRKAAWLRDEGLTAWANAITHDASEGNARPVKSKASSLDGLNPSCIVLDESHAQDFALHDVLKSAQGARLNPLLLAATTAGFNLLTLGRSDRPPVGRCRSRKRGSSHPAAASDREQAPRVPGAEDREEPTHVSAA